MRELETKIAAWRETMATDLPTETVCELEAHLRDQIEALVQTGMVPEQAFARAVERLGEGRVLAREFERGGSRWFGGVHSRGARIMATTAGSLGLTAFVVYTPILKTLIERISQGLMPRSATTALHFFLLISFCVLGIAATQMSNHFLQQPTARAARTLSAYTLVMVWMLSGYVVSGLGLRFWTQIGVVLAVFAALALLWRAWANHFNQTQPRGSEHA